MENAVELYVIKDTVADDFGPVFQAVNEGVAKRQLKELLKKVSNVEEYQLFRIGYLTDSMELISKIEHIELDYNRPNPLNDAFAWAPKEVSNG